MLGAIRPTKQTKSVNLFSLTNDLTKPEDPIEIQWKFWLIGPTPAFFVPMDLPTEAQLVKSIVSPLVSSEEEVLVITMI